MESTSSTQRLAASSASFFGVENPAFYLAPDDQSVVSVVDNISYDSGDEAFHPSPDVRRRLGAWAPCVLVAGLGCDVTQVAFLANTVAQLVRDPQRSQDTANYLDAATQLGIERPERYFKGFDDVGLARHLMLYAVGQPRRTRAERARLAFLASYAHVATFDRDNSDMAMAFEAAANLFRRSS